MVVAVISGKSVVGTGYINLPINRIINSGDELDIQIKGPTSGGNGLRLSGLCMSIHNI